MMIFRARQVNGLIQKITMLFLIGLAAICWAGYSVITGKGHYKGCPSGGWDRSENPLNFWFPTLILFGMGMLAILVALGVIPRRP